MATHTSVSFDAGFENPEFSKEGIWKHCLNSAKGAKINGNDAQCCGNIEKLYGECERLSEICKKKTTIINQRKKEYERFQRDKKELEEMKNKVAGGGVNASMISETDMKAKDAEIAYLEATLRKKEEENQKLKKDIERVLQDQMQTLEKIKDADAVQPQGDLDNLYQQISDLKKKNDTIIFQLNRAEREKVVAVERAIKAEQAPPKGVSASREGPKDEGEITNTDLQMQLNPFYKLETEVYHAFNKNLKRRLKFISDIIEWDDWADEIIDGEVKPAKAAKKQFLAENGTKIVKDGEMADEHFCASKSELGMIMEKVYFPVIDVQEHDQQYGREDYAMKKETEKFHDTIAVELITLEKMLSLLGFADASSDQKTAMPFTTKMNEAERIIVAGLMKRLFGQLPAYEPGRIGQERLRSCDFQVQVTNFYLLLQKRISMKSVFQSSLDINMSKAASDIDGIAERVMNTICDYEAYCEIEEANLMNRRRAPIKVHEAFQRKIREKMVKLQNGNPDNKINLANLGLGKGQGGGGGNQASGSKYQYEQSPQSSR